MTLILASSECNYLAINKIRQNLTISANENVAQRGLAGTPLFYITFTAVAENVLVAEPSQGSGMNSEQISRGISALLICKPNVSFVNISQKYFDI